MIFLFLRILFNTSFSQLLRFAQVRDGQMLPTALVNYVVAALAGGVILFFTRPAAPQAISLWLGVTTGVTYAVAMLGIEPAMRLSGVGITVAVLQLSVLVPTVASMLFFRERPNFGQGIGILAAVMALPLLSRAPAVIEGARVPVRATALILVSLFLVAGGSGVAMKAFEECAPAADRPVYSVALFAVSSLVIAVAVAIRRMPWGPLAWPVGGLVGLSNLLQLEVTLRALAALPAFIVFPISSALTIALNTLLAVVFWNERLDGRARLGIVLAILSAILLNR